MFLLSSFRCEITRERVDCGYTDRANCVGGRLLDVKLSEIAWSVDTRIEILYLRSSVRREIKRERMDRGYTDRANCV